MRRPESQAGFDLAFIITLVIAIAIVFLYGLMR